MAFSGRGGMRGMGGGVEGAVWQQQRARGYLNEGKPDVRRTLGRVWKLLRFYRWQLTLGTLVMLLGVGIGLIPPLLIRTLIDVAIPQHNLSLAIWLGSGLVLFPLGSSVLGLGQNYLSIVIAQGLIADLRERLYRHVQALGLEFFTWTRAGEIYTRFLNDAGGLQNVLTQSFLGTFANLIALVGTLTIMATINWRLTLAAIVSLPAFAFPVLHFGRRRYTAMERAQAALGELSVVLEETLSLSGAIVVKSFGTETREAERFNAVNTTARKAQIAQLLEGQWLSVVVQVLATFGPALLYTYGAYLVMTRQVALGTIVAFATYLTQLYVPASSLAGANATLLGGLALFDRVFQYLDLPISIPEPIHPQPLPLTPREGIVFEHVSFHYPGGRSNSAPIRPAVLTRPANDAAASTAAQSGGTQGNEAAASSSQDTSSTALPRLPFGSDEVQGVRFAQAGRAESASIRPANDAAASSFAQAGRAEKEVLYDVSFTAPLGQLTALVGPSGAGKSTMLALAAHFYNPTSGAIRLDGIALPEIARQDLRRRIAVVTQELFLFHASLRENICYGVPEASDAQVEAVVEAAQLRDLVERLPEGLATLVGERGYRLSGGEKQRVAIARALLRQAPYLLLDEATSSLDSQVERRIQAALETLIKGRTVIAIAHRLSTIQQADQIFVVQQGRIVERGTHATLLRQSGLYQRLYAAQFAPDRKSSTASATVDV